MSNVSSQEDHWLTEHCRAAMTPTYTEISTLSLIAVKWYRVTTEMPFKTTVPKLSYKGESGFQFLD